MDLDVEAYARVMAELAAAGEARADVLAAHGLDEDRWSTIDTHWQDRLSEALDDESDGAPPLIAAYASAYEAAQRSLSPLIPLEQFAQVTRLLHATGDLRAALARTGVAFSDYVRGSEHWSRQITADPEVERRFEAALRKG